MLPVKYIAAALPYATATTVLTGVIFGILTVRQWQRTRYLTAASELVQTLRDEAFTRSIMKILALPEDVRPSTVLANDELMHSAYVVGHVFETLGLLVYHRLLPLQLVDELIGGYVRSSWRRLQPYLEVRRGALGPTLAEWFQWLAERLSEHEKPGRLLGAANTYRRWRP
jgi:hypothetical protein